MAVGRVLDLSSNDHDDPPGKPGGGTPINWPLVKAAGVTTVIVKATEGLTYTNPWYRADMAGAASVGIDTLAYHFAGFGDPVAEAKFFMATAGVAKARVLDIETSTNVPWMRTFLATLGLDPTQEMTYGSASTFAPIRAQIPGLSWCAAYGQGYPGWGVLWQFTDAAQIPGIPTLCDESRWYGTELQYDLLFGVNDPLPPLPEGIDMAALELVVVGGTVQAWYVSATGDVIQLEPVAATPTDPAHYIAFNVTDSANAPKAAL